MYSRSSASRTASSAAHHAVANRQNCPPPQPQPPRRVEPAVSTNNPPPARNIYAANGKPIDLRTHIVNAQQHRANNPADLRHSLNSSHARRGSFTRFGPPCFGPMIQGERYPEGFKGPRDVEKYEPTMDPEVWIDTYMMAMGILNAPYLLAAKYLNMMLEGSARQWINALPKDSIDS